MAKLYVQETKRESVDNEKLVTVEVHQSKPSDFKYIVWPDK